MKLIGCFFLLFVALSAKGQLFDWQKTHDWKMYDVPTNRGLKISKDSLVQFKSISMNDDSVHFFLKHLDTLPKEKYYTWMGAYYATCITDSITCKIDISVYAGFLYNEQTKRYYQLPKYTRNDWLNWVTGIKVQLSQPDEIK